MLRIIREVEPPAPSTRLASRRRALRRGQPPHRTAPTPEANGGDLDWIVMRCLEKDRAAATKRPTGWQWTSSGTCTTSGHRLPAGTALQTAEAGSAEQTGLHGGSLRDGARALGLAASLWQAGRAEREAARAKQEADRAAPRSRSAPPRRRSPPRPAAGVEGRVRRGDRQADLRRAAPAGRVRVPAGQGGPARDAAPPRRRGDRVPRP